jgi:hypothetical protein
MIVSSITSPAGTGRKTQPAPETAPQAETLPSSRALVSLESPSRTTERYGAAKRTVRGPSDRYG